MARTIADPSLGLNDQAYAVLAMLGRAEPTDLGAKYDDTSREYEIEIKTFAWYNGRERGVLLEVRPHFTSKKALLVTFGECRSGDSIFVDSWEVEEHFLNPPTPADFPDEAYERREVARYGDVAKAVDLIKRKIRTFMDAERAPVPLRVLPDLGEDEEAAPVVRIGGRRRRRA